MVGDWKRLVAVLVVMVGMFSGCAGQPNTYHFASDPPGAVVSHKAQSGAMEQIGVTPCTVSTPNTMANLDNTPSCEKPGYVDAKYTTVSVKHLKGEFAGEDDFVFHMGFCRLKAEAMAKREDEVTESKVRSIAAVKEMTQGMRQALQPMDVSARVITTQAFVRDMPDEAGKALARLNTFDEVQVVGAQQWGWVYVAKDGKDFGWVDSRRLDLSFDDVPQACGDASVCAERRARLSTALQDRDRYTREQMFFNNIAHLKTFKNPVAEWKWELLVRDALAKGKTFSEPEEFWKGEEERPDKLGTTKARPVPSEWYSYICPTGRIYHAAIPATQSKACNAAFKQYAHVYGCSLEEKMGKADAAMEQCW